MQDTTDATLAGTLPAARGRTKELAPGARLGRYEIIERVGAGGMGVVFSAHDPLLDRRVALKVLHAEWGTATSRAWARLRREAQALARLNHPNVVTIHDVGAVEGERFIAMELVEGTTLGQWLRDHEPVPWPRTLDLLEAAGRGLAAVHRAGLVHRDFKPDNVMVTSEGRVLVMDFGVAHDDATSPAPARASEDGASWSDGEQEVETLTRTGALLGTPRYMSPEQLSSHPADARSDQFSFCLTAWEALLGVPAFPADTLATLTVAVTTGAIAPVPASTSVPPAVIRVLRRGLARDPVDRHPSMDALLDALGRARRRRRGWITWAVAGTVVVAGLGWYLARPREPTGSCDAHDRMAEVWSTSRRDEVGKSLIATEVPYADAAALHVTEQVDGWVQQWSAAYTEACATLVAREGDAPLDRQMLCLDERRRELDHLLTVLAQADETVAEHATSAVLRLRSPESCRADLRGTGDVAQPDPQIRGAVREVEDALQEAAALRSAGLFHRALARAQPAHARALTLDYPPLHARAWLELGTDHRFTGNLEAAAKALESAFATATAQGMDEVAAHAAIGLSVLTGDKLARPDEGRRWIRDAEAASRRLGSPVDLEGERAYALSALCIAEGDFACAEEHAGQALALRTKAHGEQSIQVAISRRQLGIVLMRRGRLPEARDHLEHALSAFEASLGLAHPDVALLLGDLGGLYRTQGDMARAREHFERMVALLESGPAHPLLAQGLSNVGVQLAMEGRREDALPYFDRALALTETLLGPEHPDIGTLLSNRGSLLSGLGRHEQAHRDQQRALVNAEATLPPMHPRLAMTLENLGSSLHQLGRPAEAMPLFDRAVPIWEKLDDAGRDLGLCLQVRARSLAALDRHAEARDDLERALRIFEDHLPAMTSEASAARFSLAKALVESGGERDRALALARQARDGFAAADDPEQRTRVEAWLAER